MNKTRKKSKQTNSIAICLTECEVHLAPKQSDFIVFILHAFLLCLSWFISWSNSQFILKTDEIPQNNSKTNWFNYTLRWQWVQKANKICCLSSFFSKKSLSSLANWFVSLKSQIRNFFWSIHSNSNAKKMKNNIKFFSSWAHTRFNCIAHTERVEFRASFHRWWVFSLYLSSRSHCTCLYFRSEDC